MNSLQLDLGGVGQGWHVSGGRVDVMKLLLRLLYISVVATTLAVSAANADPPRSQLYGPPYESGIGDDDAPTVQLNPSKDLDRPGSHLSVRSRQAVRPRIDVQPEEDSRSFVTRLIGRARLLVTFVVYRR